MRSILLGICLAAFLALILVAAKADKVSASNIACGRVISQSQLVLKAAAGIYTLREVPFTGTSYSVYANNIISEETQFRNGKKHGIVLKYFTDGSISYLAHYINGRLYGESLSWWKNGGLRTISNHNMGVVNGYQYSYYAEGMLFKKQQYILNVETGLQQAWRKNGAIYCNYEVRSGRHFGMEKANLCYSIKNEIPNY